MMWLHRWQISAGEFFELLRPLAFALAALASAAVLFDARRARIKTLRAIIWTSLTFFFPLVILPLYVMARAGGRKEPEVANVEPVPADAAVSARTATADRVQWKYGLPALYLFGVASLGGLIYYRDYQSVDAHLARANQARLLDRRQRTIQEYQAALLREDDPHTHNLLGIELAADGQWPEALAEFLAAERGGEPDDELPLRTANVLEALHRPTEAVLEYQKFLGGSRCRQNHPYRECHDVEDRLKERK